MDNFKNIDTAIEDTKRLRQEGSSGAEGNILYLLASGGYNDVWLISPPYQDAERYVLRIPKQGTLLPDQIRNEVAFLTFVKKKLLSVPVPKVLSHSLDGKTWPTPFIAEEFMDGERLSSVWATYDEPTKLAVAHQIAEIIVELAETTSTGIGGLMLEHELGPTVEGMKLSKGRVGNQGAIVSHGHTNRDRINSILHCATISVHTHRPRIMYSRTIKKRFTTTCMRQRKISTSVSSKKFPKMPLS